MEIKQEKNIKPTQQFYDWGSKDFFNIATSAGETFEKAEKSHDIGEDIINTLFKNDMMFIYEDPELMKLAGELATLKKATNKKKAKDDFTDALRYAITKVPWNFSGLGDAFKEVETVEELTPQQAELRARRKAFEEGNQDESDRIEEEFEELNDQYG